MTILTVSDLHGRSVWNEIDFDAYDQVIFLGDYTDSRVLDDEAIHDNLRAIIRRKVAMPDKIVLLIGNHDAQYMHYPDFRCTGFRRSMQPTLSDLFNEQRPLFQLAHQQGPYLFTHAGVSTKWLGRFLKTIGQASLSVDSDYNLAGLLNTIHQQTGRFRDILFDIGPHRGGYASSGGPVWADRSETVHDYLVGFHQVVGHTPIEEFTTIGDEKSSITYTDVLQTRTAFYEIIIPD